METCGCNGKHANHMLNGVGVGFALTNVVLVRQPHVFAEHNGTLHVLELFENVEHGALYLLAIILFDLYQARHDKRD